MISHFTGGNTMQPSEPVLSRAEWDGMMTVRPAVNCPRPEPTALQTWRVAMHRTHTEKRRADPKTHWIQPVPFFDDEPTVRCEEVCRVSHNV